MSNNQPAQGSNFGFDDALEDAASEFADWTPDKPVNDKPPVVDKAVSREAAADLGFTSREAKPASRPDKEPDEQVLIRGPRRVVQEFRKFGKTQTPKWPHALVLERAMAALKREMEGQGS